MGCCRPGIRFQRSEPLPERIQREPRIPRTEQFQETNEKHERRPILDVRCTFIPGSLKDNLLFWKSLTSDSYILNAVAGYKLELWDMPSQSAITQNSGDPKLLLEETMKLSNIGVVRQVRYIPGQIISPVFLVPKKNDTFRMILNLKHLNQSVVYEHFKMSSIHDSRQLIRPQSYLASVDLEKAYYSVSIHPEHRKFLRFQLGDQLFEYQVLPNGLSSAPRLFTSIMRVLFSHLRSSGFTSLAYIDDSLLVESSYEKCKANIEVTVELFQKAGFCINWEKSVLEPVSSLEFLGFQFDTQSYMLTLPLPKAKRLIELVGSLLESSKIRIRIRDIARVIGFIISIMPAFKYGRLHYRDLESCKIRALKKARGDYDSFCRLDVSAIQDLMYWKEVALTESGVSIYDQNLCDEEFHSDASLKGFGGVFKEEVFGDEWCDTDLERCGQNINALEMMAVWHGLKAFQAIFCNKSILVRCDNSTAVHYINNMGAQGSDVCNLLAKDIWQWCKSQSIKLAASFIPGKCNVEADHMSRLHENTECSLSHQAFQKIVSFFGMPEIDLFASASNAKVAKYVSWKPDKFALSVDAFNLNWEAYDLIYVFPPFSQLLRIVRQADQQARNKTIIVYPDWPAQVWYTTLRASLKKGPFPLPRQPLTKPHPLGRRLKLMCGLI